MTRAPGSLYLYGRHTDAPRDGHQDAAPLHGPAGLPRPRRLRPCLPTPSLSPSLGADVARDPEHCATTSSDRRQTTQRSPERDQQSRTVAGRRPSAPTRGHPLAVEPAGGPALDFRCPPNAAAGRQTNACAVTRTDAHHEPDRRRQSPDANRPSPDRQTQIANRNCSPLACFAGPAGGASWSAAGRRAGRAGRAGRRRTRRAADLRAGLRRVLVAAPAPPEATSAAGRCC